MNTPLPPPSASQTPAPGYRRASLRIACVQYDVKLGQVDENIKKVQSLTRWLQPGMIDLLVLPEMALSGYVFTTPTSILPYIEPQGTGPTSRLATSLARRLRCHVVAGYPEALSPRSDGTGSQDTLPLRKDIEAEGAGVGFNSAVLAGPKGDVIGNYRKTFRFETDKAWAREGDGFAFFDLPDPIGRIAIAICMDMNPKDFIAPWDAFELANYCRNNSVDVLVVPMNWLDPPAEPPNVDPPLDPLSPSEHNINYWAARLAPLHDPTPGYSSPTVEAAEPSTSKEIVFVACNRVGEEEGSKFVGTSCVMTMSANPSRIELVECCNMSEERILMATVT